MLKVTSRLDRRSFLSCMAVAWFAASRPLIAAVQPIAAVRPDRWIVTTASSPWRLGPNPIRRSLSEPDGFDVEVLTDKPMQTMEGFGACFNEMGWDALQRLSASDRDAIFVELFGESGAGFNLCRMPV